MSGLQLRRSSDRWITPGVIKMIVVAGLLLVLGTAAGAVWAELNGGRGLVVIDVVMKTLAAYGSVVSSVLLFFSRFQWSRIEVAAAAAAAAPAPVREEPTPPAEERTAATTTVPPTTDSPPEVATPEPEVEPLEPAVEPVEPPAPARLDDTTSIPVVRRR